jgi:hypothetical protein
MNYRRLTTEELSNFAANVKTLLAGTLLTSIDDSVRTELETAFGTKPADLMTQSSTADVAETQRKAAVSIKDMTRTDIIRLLGRVRDSLKSAIAPKDQYDLCGFDFPETPVSVYVAQDPTELSAFGYSNGIIKGRFSGNNNPGTVVYEVWRRQDNTAPWALCTTTRKQSFTDTPVQPGQLYEYKIRAVAAKSVSYFSNSTIVYGVL